MKYLLLLATVVLFSCSSNQQEKQQTTEPGAPEISSSEKEKIDHEVSMNEARRDAIPSKRHRVRMGNIPGEVQGFFDGEVLKRIEGELMTENGKEFDTYVYENEQLIYSTHFQFFNAFSGKDGPYAIEQKLYYTNGTISQVESRNGAPQNEKLDHMEFIVSNPDMEAIQEMYGARLAAYSRALGQGRAQ